jgi:DNA-binding NarL/FixJ family response regulator
MKKIRVLVADDHAIVRMGLVALLATDGDIEVVGEAEDGKEAVKLAESTKPDVVIMDIMMPVMDGIDATAEIVKRVPGAKVLVLTTSNSSDDYSRALAAGARGIVVKRAANMELLSSIRKVADEKTVMSPETRRLMQEDPPAPKFTDRQLGIIHSMMRGLTNHEIATQFNITPDCVKAHIKRVCNKIGAANRTEAVVIAIRKHLLKI